MLRIRAQIVKRYGKDENENKKKKKLNYNTLSVHRLAIHSPKQEKKKKKQMMMKKHTQK